MSIDVLQEKIRSLKNPVMVGLDPYLPILPQHIVRDAFDAHGQTLQGAAAAYERFCMELLDGLTGLVPAVKLQSACFEALGAAGIEKMQIISQYASERGFYVLMDSMRGTWEILPKFMHRPCSAQSPLERPPISSTPSMA